MHKADGDLVPIPTDRGLCKPISSTKLKPEPVEDKVVTPTGHRKRKQIKVVLPMVGPGDNLETAGPEEEQTREVGVAFGRRLGRGTGPIRMARLQAEISRIGPTDSVMSRKCWSSRSCATKRPPFEIAPARYERNPSVMAKSRNGAWSDK